MRSLQTRLLWSLSLLLAGGPCLAAVGKDGPTKGAIIKRPFNPKDRRRLPASWRIAGNHYVNKSEYADLKGGVMELLKRYPPNKYFFVGLGRDPAPVIAFLQNLGDKQLAVNLPGTSNIGWDGNVPPVDVARHIQAAIPERVLQGSRDIVVLDVTSSGKTPAIFGPYLERYLASRNINKKVVKLAFSWNNVKQRGAGYDRRLTDWIDTNQWQDFSNFYGGKYEGSWEPGSGGEGVGEHQRHEMGPGVIPPKETNPNYSKFRKALLARMRQDQELDGFLAKEKGMSAKVDPVVDSSKAQREREAELQAVPERISNSASSLVAKLAKVEPRAKPRRQQSNYYGYGAAETKAPSLSPNGKEMAEWLSKTLEGRSEGLARDQVGLHFIVDTLETAMRQKKIDGLDYRRLLGQALGVISIDDTTLDLISARYEKSPDMKAELRAGKDYFMRGEQYNSGRTPTRDKNMTGNYRLIMTKLAPRVPLE